MAAGGQRVPKNGGLREERHALLQRVLWSRQFETAARLREFLLYVCERVSQEPAAEIHEQEIGHRVFGRNADYDTSQDNIVRVSASQARRKLQQYFAMEGASEPFILEIPKGQYAPIYRERSTLAAEASPGATNPEIAPRFPFAVISVLLAILAVWLAVELRSARLSARSELDASPALKSLWSQLLPGAGRTDLVVADSSVSLLEDLLGRPLTLAEYLKPDLWMTADSLSSKPDLQEVARLAARRRYTSVPNVNIAARIALLSGRDQSRLVICSARDLNIRQMKSDNVILLGSKRANPWAALIEDRLNFRFGFDPQSRESYFENRQPRPGEPGAYRNDTSVSYCHIALVPNLGRTGAILAIAGTEIEGTEVGGEFVTSAHSIEQLQRLIPLDREGRLPYFEALLKSSKVGGATPGFSIVASRLVKP